MLLHNLVASVTRFISTLLFFFKDAPRLYAEQQEKKRHSQLLSMLILISGMGMALLLGLTNLPNLDTIDPLLLIPETLGLLVFILCYFLNRHGLTFFAAFVLFITINFLIIFYLALDSVSGLVGDMESVPCLLVIPVVAAGVILGPRYSFIFAGISTACLLVLICVRVSPTIPHFENLGVALFTMNIPLTLILTMSGLSWYFESTMQVLIGQVTAQNETLLLANQELSKKRQIEQELSLQADALTNQITNVFTNQNELSKTQLAIVTHFSTAMEQLNQTGQVIAQATQQVDNTAQQALQVAHIGTDTIRGSLDAISLLSTQVQAQANTLHHLYEQTRQINQINVLSAELTEEVSLLALNAKIEAAGAGVHALRFGVVADEMQRLATRSRDFADQVQRVVREVQSAVQNSADWATNSARETLSVIHGTRSVEETLGGIVAMVDNTAKLARQITLSIQEQQTSVVEAVETVHQLSMMATTVSGNNQAIINSLERLNFTVDQLVAAPTL